MAVTKTPEVGKVLVKSAPSSTAAYPWYVEGGEITRISGQRIYYKDGGGTERFSHDAAAVCDTQDEAGELLAFSDKEKKAYEAYMQGIATRNDALLGTLTKPAKLAKQAKQAKAVPPAAKAPTPEKNSGARVRRSR